MNLRIEALFLSREKEVAEEETDDYDYTDVVVKMDDGNKYIASFFSYDSIGYLNEKHQQTGAFLAGKYFRADNMLLIESCTKSNVVAVIEDLLEEGEFRSVFQLLTKQ